MAGGNGPENDERPPPKRGPQSCEIGGDLLSQGVSSQVPSAQAGLTSVFGKGTGVTPPLLPPKPIVSDTARARSLENSIASTSIPVQTKPSAD